MDARMVVCRAAVQRRYAYPVQGGRNSVLLMAAMRRYGFEDPRFLKMFVYSLSDPESTSSLATNGRASSTRGARPTSGSWRAARMSPDASMEPAKSPIPRGLPPTRSARLRRPLRYLGAKAPRSRERSSGHLPASAAYSFSPKAGGSSNTEPQRGQMAIPDSRSTGDSRS